MWFVSDESMRIGTGTRYDYSIKIASNVPYTGIVAELPIPAK
jgi:hypothetical protein